MRAWRGVAGSDGRVDINALPLELLPEILDHLRFGLFSLHLAQLKLIDAVSFQPFAEKLVLPCDAVAVVLGDLHGDIRSLLRVLDELQRQKTLDGFKLRDAKHHLIFLGDYTDRGHYGTEVLYTLLRLIQV